VSCRFSAGRAQQAPARPDTRCPAIRVLAVRTLILAAGLCFSASAPALHPDPVIAEDSHAAPPYSPGETLRYKVMWDPPWYLFFLPEMEAGELRLSLGKATMYGEKPAAPITFEARSSGTLASLTGVKVEDTFESLADPETLCTYAVRKRVREGKRKRDIEVTYYPEDHRLHILDTDVAKSPPHVNKDKFVDDIPACVHDVFAAVYALRRADLHVGSRDQWVLGDDDNIKRVETLVVKSEIVQGHAGPVRSLRIETIALLGGLFREGGHFRIWLSEDAHKLPVMFEIQVKLGRAYGRLVSVTP
jgi:Protein of unknown function (DUF3108)